MNHSIVYEYRFNELLKILRHERWCRRSEDGQCDQIIDICGNEFRQYQKMISRNEPWGIYTVCKIVQGLFDMEGIQCYVPKHEDVNSSGKEWSIPPYFFTAREKNRNIAYSFLYKQITNLDKMRKEFREYNVDGVKIVFLESNYKERIDLLNKTEVEEDNAFISFYEIKEFFDEKFGEEEFPIFMSYVERFNERARNLIGYKTVAIPTENNIKRFREQKTNLLKGKDYDAIFPGEIDTSQKKVILDNYINNNRYILMLGYKDFSDSFISSEWYYGIHTVTGAIDETGLVTGYLKSVEQLLYSLIRLSIGKGKIRYISINPKKKKDYPKDIIWNNNIEFTESNEEFVDKTLGSLIRFIKYKNNTGGFHNADLFDVDEHTIQVIVDVLYAFKDVERNDRFHKDNLYTIDEIEKIREQAILLYCLILGGFKIDSSMYAKLVRNTESLITIVDEDDLLKIIMEWATPIVRFDVPKESHTVAFNIKKHVGSDWELCLQGLEMIPEDKYKTIEWNYRIQYSSSTTSNNLTWKSEGEYKNELEKLIRVLRLLMKGDSEVAVWLRSFPEVVLGDGEVIEILNINNKKG